MIVRDYFHEPAALGNISDGGQGLGCAIADLQLRLQAHSAVNMERSPS